jgi:hypothetical protein
MQIKSFTPENKIPAGLLTGGVEAIKSGKLNIFQVLMIFLSFGRL